MEKELINNSQSNIYPFHMPGHKRRGSDIGAELDPYAIDITEIDNFDNLHHAEGIIKDIFFIRYCIIKNTSPEIDIIPVFEAMHIFS